MRKFLVRDVKNTLVLRISKTYKPWLSISGAWNSTYLATVGSKPEIIKFKAVIAIEKPVVIWLISSAEKWYSRRWSLISRSRFKERHSNPKKTCRCSKNHLLNYNLAK